jgi:hypothetical protein
MKGLAKPWPLGFLQQFGAVLGSECLNLLDELRLLLFVKFKRSVSSRRFQLPSGHIGRSTEFN